MNVMLAWFVDQRHRRHWSWEGSGMGSSQHQEQIDNKASRACDWPILVDELPPC
jgi:hypothetical protein